MKVTFPLVSSATAAPATFFNTVHPVPFQYSHERLGDGVGGCAPVSVAAVGVAGGGHATKLIDSVTLPSGFENASWLAM